MSKKQDEEQEAKTTMVLTIRPVIAEAIEHIDVKGNKQYYLRLDNGTHNYWVNVGLKTYETVKALQQGEETPATFKN